jgi:hypothetical protein
MKLALPPGRGTTSATDGSHGPLGRTEPRLFTPPLRELTPDTSYGFDVVDFAESIGRPLDPWQQWAVIHLGELLPDGRPRFRKVLVMVARQNGKTELLVILTLFWLFIDQIGLVLGMSTKLDYARESWQKACSLARRSIYADEIETIRRANGEQELVTVDDCRYKIAASNAEGGRSLTVGRLVMDELRQQFDYSAWDAAVPATNAVYDAQVVAITNQGSDRSVVLNDLRAAALAYIESGQGDDRLGLLEWSAPEDADPLDLDALAMANPNLGYRIDPDVLLADARAAVAAGGEKLSGFRTEIMCIRVKSMDAAINPDRWRAAADPAVVQLVRAGCALAVDVSPDFRHVSLVAAAVLPDGRTGLRVAGSWSGENATTAFRTALPGLLRAIRPRVLGWLPQGPSATLAADLRRFITTTKGEKPVQRLHGVRVEEIKAEVAGVCMSLAEQVDTGRIVHPADPLLTQHALAAERKPMGDGWRFDRGLEDGSSPVDAAYAAALAVHLARSAPAGLGPVRVVLPRQS